MKVLLTGGAGYIGSHVNKLFTQKGHETVVLDNLFRGHRDAVLSGKFIEADLLDYPTVERTLRDEAIEAVVHFAGLIFVGESVGEPQMYYENNVIGSLNLLRAMKNAGIKDIIFSSTAAVYGFPDKVPVSESAALKPINPYGWSKLMMERYIEDYCSAYGMRSVILRYFNAAGADPEGFLGERHDPENHLIPLMLMAVKDRSRTLTIHGTDYPTPDGTAIRDYIHVMDLAEAHALGLEKLAGEKEGFCGKYNVGIGRGFSVNEVLLASALATGSEPMAVYGPRRAGDSAELVADSALIRRELGWAPRWPELNSIIEHAWNFINR